MKKNSLILIGFIGFMLSISVGYALFSETIIINGTATAMGTFDVEFTSATISEQIGATNSTATISSDKNSLDISVPKLEYPGAYVDVFVTVTNKGSIPAFLESVVESGLTTDKSIKVSYVGLNELKNVVLNQNDSKTFRIRVLWDEKSNVSSKDVNFTIKLNYRQTTN